MIGTILGALGGKLVEGIAGIVDQYVDDGDLAARLKSELSSKILTLLGVEIEAARDVVIAEIKGDSWLQKNWRPMLMCVFGAIILNNHLIYPYLKMFWSAAPKLEDLPQHMWELLKIGVGGYIVGRSVEKGVKLWKG